MAAVVKNLPVLPIERAIRTISGRWKAVILYYLLVEPRRQSQLARLLPGASQKVLIQQLRELEMHGLIGRRQRPGRPLYVEYSATPLGRSLQPLLVALCEWGQAHAEELGEADRIVDCIVDRRMLARA